MLSLNMVAGMDQLAQVRAAAGDLQQVAAYQPGDRYADYSQARTSARPMA